MLLPENWRPPNWKNRYEDKVEAILSRGGHRGSISTENLEGQSRTFEVGADAMYPFAYEKGKVQGKIDLMRLLHEPCYKHDTSMLRLGCPECWKNLRRELDYEY